MQRWTQYILPTLLWCGVAAYLVYAALSVREVRTGEQVTQVEIVVADSTGQGTLIKSSDVRRALKRNNIRIVGCSPDSIDLSAIERLIGRNGFVEQVVAYHAKGGVLRIELSQREPIVRLRLGQSDRYATSEGYLFESPKRTSLYMPVVTGSYQPPVPNNFTGPVFDHILSKRATTDSLVEVLEREKYPYRALERASRRKARQEQRRQLPRHWLHWLGAESDEEYEEKRRAFELRQLDSVRKYLYRVRVNREAIERLTARQERLRNEQKKLEKSYEDFTKLLTFVDDLEHNDFWRSEVVQIEAYTTPSRELELTLIPRSGPFAVRFGRIEDVDEKFRRLERFYKQAMPRLGWDRFREVDLRYADRVVCR